jgi:hypothetical protein
LKSLRNSWFIARFEIRRTGLGYLWSTLFFAYAAIMVTFVFDEVNSSVVSDRMTSNFVVDFYFLAILAASGFISFSRHYWGYWKSKALTKKAMFFKAYPISAPAAVEGKMILMLFNIVLQNGIFFLILWLIPSELHQMLASLQFMEFVLLWVGYSLTCGSFYVYLETSLKERQYLIVCIGIGIAILGLIGLMWLFKIHLIKESIFLVQQYGIWGPIILFLLGILTFITLRMKGIQCLQARDFYV